MNRGQKTEDRPLRKEDSDPGSYAQSAAWGARPMWTFSVIGIWCGRGYIPAFLDHYGVLDGRACLSSKYSMGI